MGISIDDLILSRILNWDETISKIIPRKNIRGETSLVDFETYVTYPKIIELATRLTDDEKDTLESIKNEGTWHKFLEDGIFQFYVWILNLEVEWRGEEDYDRPWYSTIRLLCQEPETTSLQLFIDLLIVSRQSQMINVDILLKKLGVPKTIGLDLLVKKLGLEKSLSVDLILQKPFTKSYGIDIILQGEADFDPVDFDSDDFNCGW